MKSGICYVVGAGDFGGAAFVPGADDYVIAADGGYAHLAKRRTRVDLLLGDMDSLETLPAGVPTERVPVEKDDTDMLLCVRRGQSLGYRRFRLYGASGGRLSHTVANLQLLAGLAAEGLECLLMGEEFTAQALTDGEIRFDASARGAVSVFAQGGTAYGVTLEGLKYPLRGATLTCAYPLGVSNRFTGVPSRVAVEHGTLLVVREWNA